MRRCGILPDEPTQRVDEWTVSRVRPIAHQRNDSLSHLEFISRDLAQRFCNVGFGRPGI